MSFYNSNKNYQETTKAKQPRQRYERINDHNFVQAWMTSQNMQEVCQRLDIDIKRATNKANSLRRRGVNLPHMKNKSKKYNIEQLNKLVERYSK